jgi:uncharacterized RDD family membrane protein YckC
VGARQGKKLFVLANGIAVQFNPCQPNPNAMNWYYLDNGTQRGPITDAEFAPLAQEGVINASTYLWCEGMADWKTYGELAGVSVAETSAAAVAVAEPASGLRVKRDEAVPQAAQIGCMSCGVIVPREQAVIVGTSTLCAKCAASRQRTAIAGGEYANPMLRIVAYVVDLVIIIAVFFGGLNLLRWIVARTVNDSHTRGTIGVIFFGLLILWALDCFSGRVARNGGTLGQTMLGLRVVGANGANLSFLRALGRFLIFLVINQFTLSLAQLTAFFDAQKRCLHDIVCGTVVLKK